jgi:hypothetical protein
LYTFNEYNAFLRTIDERKDLSDEKGLGNKLKKLGQAEFRTSLRSYSKYVTLKVSDLSPLRKIGVRWTRLAELDKKVFTLKQLEDKKLQLTPIIRYFCDRKESRDQS